MAQAMDRVYLPPLEDCLKGDRHILSWKLVATALSDSTGTRQTTDAISEFLKDPYVQDLFKNPTKTFAAHDDVTSAEFETRTSAIHVTPKSNGKYDVKTVKEDAQWLSKNARINLLAALRIVAIELQSRATFHLAGPLSLQDSLNLQDAAGGNEVQSTSIVATLATPGSVDADALWDEFQKEESRRARIYVTYLYERRFFLMVANYIHSIIFYERLPIATETPLLNLRELYGLPRPMSREDDTTGRRGFVEKTVAVYLDLLGELTNSLDGGLEATTDDPLVIQDDVAIDWLRTEVDQAVHATLVVFQALDYMRGALVNPKIVSRWFSMMKIHCFFEQLSTQDPVAQELQAALQTATCAVSLVLLSPTKALRHVNPDGETPSEDMLYLSFPQVMEDIHSTVEAASSLDSAAAYPTIFVWSIILFQLHLSLTDRSERRDVLLQQKSAELIQDNPIRPGTTRRSSVGSIISIDELPRDVFLRSTGLDKESQAIEVLANQTTSNGAAFTVIDQMATSSEKSFPSLQSSRVRSVFLDFFNWTQPIVPYQADPVVALVNNLSGGASYWDMPLKQAVTSKTDILAAALNNELFLENYLYTALNRFPFEFSPFLHICSALGKCTTLLGEGSDEVLSLLRRTSTLTFNLPDEFQAYELVFEDENTNSFRILEPLPLFIPRPRTRRHVAVDDFCIPAGSYGRFVTDSGRVVQMDFEYSLLAFLGSCLQLSLSQSDYRLVLSGTAQGEVAESIGLLAILIRAECLKASLTGATDQHQSAIEVIEEASKSIDNNKDVISIVCDILDSAMQDDAAMGDDQDLAVLTSCVQFLHATLPVYPSRILSYMARCDLLSSDSRAGRLARLTGNLDMADNQFDFLASTIRLLSAVVDTIMSSSVQRKCGSKLKGRLRIETDSWLGTSEKTLSRLGHAISVAAVDVFENWSTWKLRSDVSYTVLLKEVVPLMKNLILYAYGLDDSEGSSRPTECLEAGAEYIIDSFLSPSAGSLRFRPLQSTLYMGFRYRSSTLFHSRNVALKSQVAAVLDFSTILLRVANIYNRPVGTFETHLFKSSGLLARVSAVNECFQRPTLLLFIALVESAGRGTNEPPSLLGYLGPQVAKSFLDVLAKIGRPFSTPSEVTTIWKFFSSIIRNRQQWMSNCLISGKTPREVSEASKAKDFASESVFSTALGKIKSLDSASRLEVLCILDFVTSAQNYWPWTVFTILKDPACLDGLRTRIRGMSSSATTSKSDPLTSAYDAKEAAYIAEAFAMQLYHLRHMGGAKPAAENLLKDLDYYLRDGAVIAGYNGSLHSNFRKNFATKYPTCSVEKFKRTMLEPRDLGDNYYYDLTRADEMLRFDPGWRGPKGNGFKTEMERANLNLSLVDAQISLYHSWEFLLLELNSSLPGNAIVARYMQQVALQCLEANREGQGPENIFVRIIESRSNFALMLIQGLIGVKIAPQDVNQLLQALYGAIATIEEPFEKESAPLYRTLLKALYIILKSHAGQASSAGSDGDEISGDALVSRIQMVLDILDRVVGKGFRTLVTLIHDKNTAVSPEDLGLITAVLQACLGVPDMAQQQTQVLNIMAAHDAMHVACSLFSWSDKITDNGDPVYGELSLLFLLELSKLPMVAEQLACNGVISQLTSANLTRFMRRGVISPFADNVGAQRCYSIWAKAMLPLLLNLLTAMGTTVAPEVSYVLNQFPSLLKSSVERFEAPGTSRTASKEAMHYVTLLTAMEVHSLALLTRVISALRQNNNRDIPEVQWDGPSLLEYVEFWLNSRRLLRERLLPLGQREVEWKSMRAPSLAAAGATEGGESVLEEKVVVQLEAVRDVLAEEA
ncbi:hypothetical protein jhhlp_004677 [Lomentospora prolificans]|uniref:Nucleoporin NUP188 n=1 Tax=Lomentospora prolificans TaxID=41688 RepID=A0A2N3NCG7_9PEZI|nr:hypothetical protein jhhlp_004677 [Lomentospora prolificans]